MKRTAKKKATKRSVAKKKPVAKKTKKKPVAKKKRPAPKLRLLHPFIHRTDLVGLAVSPDGKHLATGSFVGDSYEAGGELVIWETATARAVNHFNIEGGVGWPDHRDTIQWSPDGRFVGFSGNTNGILFVEAFALDTHLRDELYLTDGSSRPPPFTWAPDSERVFVNSYRPTYDPTTRTALPVVEGHDVPGCIAGFDTPATWMDHRRAPGVATDELDYAKTFRWSGDQLLGIGNRQVTAIDTRSRTLRWLSSGHETSAIAPSGAFIACELDGRAVLLDRDGVQQPATFDARAPAAFHWSPDSTRLAIIERDEELARISLFQLDGGARATLLGRIDADPVNSSYETGFTSVAWSPASDSIAFLDGDVRINVWSVAPSLAQRFVMDDVEARGLIWAPSERLLCWGKRIVRFIDVDTTPRIVTRALFETPGDDGPFGTERLREFSTRQFPLGTNAWGVLLDDVVIAPAGNDDALTSLLGWSDGRTSAPLSALPVKRFTSIAEAVRSVPKSFPSVIRDAHGGGTKTAPSWGPSDEPREVFDLWALIELEAAAIAADPWRSNWHALLLGRLYHRARMDDAALAALEKANEWHEVLRVRLELALSCAVRGELDRARRYFATVDDELFRKAYERVSSLESQGVALRGALRQILEAKGAEEIDTAAKSITAENNRGEQWVCIVLARLALGDVDRALKHVARLDSRQRVAVVREAIPLGLAHFSAIAKEAASQEFDVMYAVTDGFISLGAFTEGFNALSWFDGLSTNAERARLVEHAQKKSAAVALIEHMHAAAKFDDLKLECVRYMAPLDAEKARAWLGKITSASAAMCLAAASLGIAEPAKEALENGPVEAAIDAIESDVRLWPALGARALEQATNDKSSNFLAGLRVAALRAGDATSAATALAATLKHAQLDRDWEVGTIAARLARGGDDAGAFALLQKLPKAKRGYAIPSVTVALGDRLAKHPEPHGFAAVCSLLSSLETESLGTGGRSFETSRVLRRLFDWSRGESDGLLG